MKELETTIFGQNAINTVGATAALITEYVKDKSIVYKQIEKPQLATAVGIILNNGTPFPSTGRSTDYLPIDPSTYTYKFTTFASDSTNAWVLFDENKTFLGTYDYDTSKPHAETIIDRVIDFSELLKTEKFKNAKYVKFQYYKGSAYSTDLTDVTVIPYEKQVLFTTAQELFDSIDPKLTSLEKQAEKQKDFVSVNKGSKYSIDSSIEIESGKFISRINGGEGPWSTGKITKSYLPITKLSNYIFSCQVNLSACSYAIYKNDKTFIKAFGYNEDKTTYTLINKEINGIDLLKDYPTAAYIRFCTMTGNLEISTTDNVYNISNIEKQINTLMLSNVLYGKKYVALGDSYTRYGWKKADHPDYFDENGELKTYPWRIANRNNMTLKNLAVSGTRTFRPTGATEITVTIETEVLKDQLPEITNADYLTIALGCNDDNDKVGTFSEDLDEGTFYGAWNSILKQIYTANPKIKIGIIINDGMLQGKPAVREGIITVAKAWGIPYLDIAEDPKVPYMFRDRTGLISYAKTLRSAVFENESPEVINHPTMECHIYRSTVIENFMRSL